MKSNSSKAPPAGEHLSGQRIAIIGAEGRLGQALVARYRDDHEVVELDRDHLDLGSKETIEPCLDPFELDLVILTAALTAVDYCEDHEDEAFAVNGEGPGEVARICAQKGIPLVYISTDFVFDGKKKGPYDELDPVNPISVYGASKLSGEEKVLAASPDNLAVRISWLFGPGAPAFPEWIIDRACGEEEVTLPHDKVGCPTSAPDLAMWLEFLLFGPARHEGRGLFHLCNSDPCTWQEWGQFCIDLAREHNVPVKAEQIGGIRMGTIPAFVAKRPENSAMSTEKFTRVTGVRPRPWQEALRDHLLAGRLSGKTAVS